MTRDQYSELVGFLGRKFDEVQRHSTALFEQSREELRVFAEGTNARFDKMDERFDEMAERFDTRTGSLERWIRRAVTDCDRRLRALE